MSQSGRSRFRTSPYCRGNLPLKFREFNNAGFGGVGNGKDDPKPSVVSVRFGINLLQPIVNGSAPLLWQIHLAKERSVAGVRLEVL
jgi:hypothetical protein